MHPNQITEITYNASKVVLGAYQTANPTAGPFDLDLFKKEISSCVRKVYGWRTKGELDSIEVTDLQMTGIAAWAAADKWNQARQEPPISGQWFRNQVKKITCKHFVHESWEYISSSTDPSSYEGSDTDDTDTRDDARADAAIHDQERPWKRYKSLGKTEKKLATKFWSDDEIKRLIRLRVEDVKHKIITEMFAPRTQLSIQNKWGRVMKDPKWHRYAMAYHATLTADRARDGLPPPHRIALAPLVVQDHEDEEDMADDEMEGTTL